MKKTGANNKINSFFYNPGSQSPCHHAMMLLVTALPGAPLPHVLTFTEYDSTSNNPHFPDSVSDETKKLKSVQSVPGVLFEEPPIQSQSHGQPIRPGKSKTIGSYVHSDPGFLSLPGCDGRLGDDN